MRLDQYRVRPHIARTRLSGFADHTYHANVAILRVLIVHGHGGLSGGPLPETIANDAAFFTPPPPAGGTGARVREADEAVCGAAHLAPSPALSRRVIVL
jgi:hypothetical protein